MERTPVIAALEGGVLTLMLNRPQRLNAMNNALIEAMNHELARARDDADIRCVLLTGLGRGFCAGADLAGGGTVDSTANVPPDLGANIDRIFNPMIRAMRELPKPIVGAINSPVVTWKLPIRVNVPCRSYSNSIRAGFPAIISLVGAFRSNA